MKMRVTLTHSVTVVVEGESEDVIQDWMNQMTPGEVQERSRKNGHPVGADYTETAEKAEETEPTDIVIGK